MTFKRSFGVLFAACALFASACGPAAEARLDDGVLDLGLGLGRERVDARVFVRDSGHWSRYVYHGVTSESFWVDLSVSRGAPGATVQDVGIVWSDDDGATWRESPARFERALGEGREQWGVDVRDFGTYAPWRAPGRPEVEYAAYAVIDGEKSWSPYRNHMIYEKVTPERPLRLLDSSVRLDDSGGVRLEGRVRALAVSGPARVRVRASTNAFADAVEIAATRGGRDYTFSALIPLAPATFDPATTEWVEFNVELEAEGETVSASPRRPFRHRLRPELRAADLSGELGFPSAGLKSLSAQIDSDLPLEAASLRFDGVGPSLELGPMAADSLSGFDRDGAVRYAFTTEALADGAHTLQLEVRSGPFTRTFELPTFHVDNRLEPRASFSLASSGGASAPWDFERAADGRAFVSQDHGVLVYPALDAATPSAAYAPSPAAAYQRQIALDPSGRVYGLSDSGLVRWTADGRLDAAFGRDGLLSLAEIAGSPLCYAADVEVSAHHLYVIDSCNARVLRLTPDGAFEDALNLEVVGRYTNVHDTFLDAGGLWVGRTTFADGLASEALLRLSDASGAPMALLEEVSLAPMGSLGAFAVVRDGFWVSSDDGVLSRLDATGRRLASWTGGCGQPAWTPPGALHIVTALDPQPDGSVDVLSVGTGRIERFGLR